jgi:hypothetical protein|tara:strand:+ start:258 stop:485 length:228 start_codon:yes stop_codon:yes gene_type:complete
LAVEVSPPRLPEPPEEYTKRYMNDLLRSLQFFIEQQNQDGSLRGTNLTLTDLPTSELGLETGALYNDSGTVKVKL